MEKVGEELREKVVIFQEGPFSRTSTPELVSRSGYVTSLLSPSAYPVEKVSLENPDLVILEIGTPSAKGLEMLIQLKAERVTRDIPVFVLGAPDQPADRAQWLTIGAADYLDYPFHPEVLNARLRAILRRHVTFSPVTHLPSGNYLQRQVDGWLAKNIPTAVLYVDIDRFRSYNSAYGWEAGNRVLEQLAQLIVDVMPVGNMSVAHMGADDFMMAFPPAGAETFVHTLVERFRAAQREFYSPEDFARGYVQERDPGMPARRWPLMSLSAAMVSNDQHPLTSYLQASSQLCRLMSGIKAEKEALVAATEHAPAPMAIPPSTTRENIGRFYERICSELERTRSREFESMASLVAAHFAETGDHDRASRFYSMAGERWRRLFAPLEARSEFENALASLSQLPERQAFLRRRIETATGYAMSAYGGGRPSQILARLNAVDSLASSLKIDKENSYADREALSRVRLSIGRILASTNRPQESLSYALQVDHYAQDWSDEQVAAQSTAEIGLTLARQGYYGRAIPLLTSGVAHSELAGDWQQWAYFSAHLAMSLVASGKVEEGRVHAEAITRRVQELKSQVAESVCQLFLSLIFMMSGEIEDSLNAARESLKLSMESEQMLIANLATAFCAWGESHAGNLAVAQEMIKLQAETASRLGGETALPDQIAALCAEVMLRLGSTSKAVELAAQAVEKARQMEGIFAEGLAERVWAKALLASSPVQYDTAERHLIASVNAFEAGGCLVEVARTRLTWGLVAASNGKLKNARRQLESASQQFEAAGLTRELEETREVLLALE